MDAKEKLGKTSSFQYSLDSVEKYIEAYHQSIKTLLAAYNEKTVPRIPALVLLTIAFPKNMFLNKIRKI